LVNCNNIKLFVLSAHDDSIWSCAWGRSNKDNVENIVTGSIDDKVKVWKWSVN